MVKYKRKIFSKYEQIFLDKGYKFDVDGNVVSPFNKKPNRKQSSGKYIRLGFTYEGESVQVLAHRLQAYIKYGDVIYGEGIVVRHLDGNPKNNKLENIAIGNQLDNWNDYVRLCESKRG